MTTLPRTVHYLQIEDTVIARVDGDSHTLSWQSLTGEVHLDREPRVIAKLFSDIAFHVFAADLLGGDRNADRRHIDLPHAPRGIREVRLHDGAIWNQIPCSCGHFRTPPCATEVEARRLMGAHLIATGVVPQQRSNQS